MNGLLRRSQLIEFRRTPNRAGPEPKSLQPRSRRILKADRNELARREVADVGHRPIRKKNARDSSLERHDT